MNYIVSFAVVPDIMFENRLLFPERRMGISSHQFRNSSRVMSATEFAAAASRTLAPTGPVPVRTPYVAREADSQGARRENF